MSMRRRRKKLTNILTTMDKQLRATTLRQVKRNVLVGSDAAEEDATTTPEGTTPPTGTQIAVDPPDQWAKVIGGYYYPPSRTGGLGQVELFIDEDLQLSASDSMYVSGVQVKWSQTSGGKTYSGSFSPNTDYDNSATIRKVLQYGNPSWTGRAASTKPVYHSVPSGVTNTIIYTVTNKSVIPNLVTLSYKGQVASYYATTTTATITFTAAHPFFEGQIVDVSSLGSPMQGIDGIVKITAVPSSTQISYEFETPLSAAITTTTPPSTIYVYAVVSKYTAVGSNWIDSSVVPNKVWIWDGLRWTGYTDAIADGLVTDDGVAPAPATSLNLSSTGYNDTTPLGKVSKSSVTLSWTAPTTNSLGGDLNDLAGYRVWYSTTSATGPWVAKQTFGQETSQTITELTPDLTYYFRVIAYDSFGLDSTGLDGNIVAVKAALSVDTPSAPTLTTRLGTVKVTWDGKDSTNGVVPVELLSRVDVHYSTTSGFTPSSSTLAGSIYRGAGYLIISDLTYNTDYYFKLTATDINGRTTSASTQGTTKIKPLVDADLIAAELNSPLSVWPFAPKAVTAGALADGALDASTVFGTGVVNQGAIAANAIGATQIAANAITAGKIEAGAVTAAKIAALAITADKIATNAITADKVQAGAITTDKLTAGTMIGFNIQTAASSTRVVMNGSSLAFYNQYDELSGNIYGWSVSSTPTLRLESGSSSIWVGNYGIELNDSPGRFLDVRYGTWLTDSTIFLSSSIAVELYTDAADQWTSISGGQGLKIEVGGPTGQAKLQVDGSSSFTGNATFNGSLIRSSMTGTGNAYAYVNANGAFLRGASVPSDRRLKTNITDTRLGLNFINQLEAVEFNFIDQTNSIDRGAQFGVIAQDVIVAMEANGVSEKNGLIYKMIQEDGVEDEFYSINHAQLVSPLIKAVQELSTRIELLESK